MTIDLVITQPTSCDFPIWRNFLRNNRDRFKDVFIIMSNTNAKTDYTSFLRKAFEKDRVHFREADSYLSLGDWRNSAVNCALLGSTSDYVWFTEQDFFIADPSDFFAKVHTLINAGNEFIYIKEGSRIHPCCMFVKRTMIDKTRKDFGVDPGKGDHFSKFVADLQKAGAKEHEIVGMGKDYYHMNGLTHNYALIEAGQIQNITQPGIFQLYNSYARMQAVEYSTQFLDLSFKVDHLLSQPYINFFRGK